MQDRRFADGAVSYHPARDRWTRIPARRVEKRVFYLTQCAAPIVHDGKLCVVGGQGESGRTRTTSYFDIRTLSFVRTADLL